jgi:hypothetical protein
VSQHAVERAIGKLATDAEFRTRFFENPAAATWEAGLVLSPVELQALAALSPAAVARFSDDLDPRISRLCLGEARTRRQTPRGSGDEPGTESTA